MASSTWLMARGEWLQYAAFGKVPLLWRVHGVHHTDTELDVSTTVRFHPLEFPISLAIGLPWVLALGFSPWVLVVYELLDVVITLVSHSNVSFPTWLERPLRYLVVTPDLHRIHHSTRPEESDSNYGAVFPAWDLFFGTFRTQTHGPAQEFPLGLENVRDQRTQSLPWLLGMPFLHRFAAAQQAPESPRPPSNQ